MSKSKWKSVTQYRAQIKLFTMVQFLLAHPVDLKSKTLVFRRRKFAAFYWISQLHIKLRQLQLW